MNNILEKICGQPDGILTQLNNISYAVGLILLGFLGQVNELSLSTSLTLLDQLRFSSPGDAWRSFVEIYAPLLLKWNREAGLQNADAEDVAQETLTAVMSEIANFSREREGSFRKWLRQIAINRIKRFYQKKPNLKPLESVPDQDFAKTIETFPYAENYYVEVLQSALFHIFKEFRGLSWEAFLDSLVLNRPIDEVARELGITVNAVYVARHRIMARLTEVVKDLIDDDDLPPLTMSLVEQITAESADTIRKHLSGMDSP